LLSNLAGHVHGRCGVSVGYCQRKRLTAENLLRTSKQTHRDINPRFPRLPVNPRPYTVRSYLSTAPNANTRATALPVPITPSRVSSSFRFESESWSCTLESAIPFPLKSGISTKVAADPHALSLRPKLPLSIDTAPVAKS
jgi:hypothetical protein